MVRWTQQPQHKVRVGSANARYNDIRVMNPSRGLNVLVADILANDKESTYGTKNIEYVEGGAATKRPGYQALNFNLSSPANGLGAYQSERFNYVMLADNGNIRKYQNHALSEPLSTTVTVDKDKPINFTSLYQKTYIWDKTNGGVVWDGNKLERPGTMPRAEGSVIYKGYHVAFGTPGQPFRLYFAPAKEPSRFTNSVAPSDPNDIAINNAEQVPGATVFAGDQTSRAIDINKNDGQAVTGLGFFQDVLIVFKERSIFQLSFNDSNNFVVQRVSSSYGCVSHNTIASVENDCYFLTDKGVYVLGNEPNYYAAIRTNELSSRIKNLLKDIPPAEYTRCTAVYYDDRYWLSVPLNSERNNTLIVYDRRFYAWALWDNVSANDILAFVDKDNDRRYHLIFADDKTTQIQEFIWGKYDDNGEPIEAVFITRAFEAKSIEREKYWYELFPIFRLTTGSVQISYETENGTAGRPVELSTGLPGGLGTDQFGQLIYGTSQSDTYTENDLGLSNTGGSGGSSVTNTSHTTYEIGVNIDSRTLKIRFSNDTVGETFTLLGWVLVYQLKDLQNQDGNYTFL